MTTENLEVKYAEPLQKHTTTHLQIAAYHV